jgi:hypothetical protein
VWLLKSRIFSLYGIETGTRHDEHLNCLMAKNQLPLFTWPVPQRGQG